MSAPNATPTTLVFLKAPRLGTVKTRLAADIGQDRALEAYRHLATTQLARLPKSWPVEIHFAPSEAHAEMQAWLGPDFHYEAQPEGDLGRRLQAATENAFQRGASCVFCIGADCPQLHEKQFAAANGLLESGADAVFGPAQDGGYYLLALAAPQPELFHGIPWSAANTLSVSLERAEAAGLRVEQLETLFDIDDLSDLQRAVSLELCPAKLIAQ